MAHEIFVGVAQNVITLGSVAPEVEGWVVEDRDEIGEAVDHLLALTQLVGVVEVGNIDYALEVVFLGKFADDLVDLIADLLVPLERHHVSEAAALGHLDQRIFLSGVSVGDVLNEQQDEDVVLILRGIHAAAQFIATSPEGAIKFGFL